MTAPKRFEDLSLPERMRAAVSHPYEREAVALLYRAGWSVRELQMCFECSDSTIYRVLKSEGIPHREKKPEGRR